MSTWVALGSLLGAFWVTVGDFWAQVVDCRAQKDHPRKVIEKLSEKVMREISAGTCEPM